MRAKKSMLVALSLALAIGLVFMACDTQTGGTTGTTSGRGSLYAGMESQARSARAVINGEDFGDFPLDDFSIEIVYLQGSNTNVGNNWDILNYGSGQKEHVIPITSQIKIANLSSLRPQQKGTNVCDFIQFDINLLYKGSIIANFPESMFIKGEEFAFYQNTSKIFGSYDDAVAGGYVDNFDVKDLRPGWKWYKIIFDKYKVARLGDDFVVIPFDGIDLQRNFDLKFEWDISILVKALKDANEEDEGYSAVQNRTSSFFQDFFKSFSLKVVYLD